MVRARSRRDDSDCEEVRKVIEVIEVIIPLLMRLKWLEMIAISMTMKLRGKQSGASREQLRAAESANPRISPPSPIICSVRYQI